MEKFEIAQCCALCESYEINFDDENFSQTDFLNSVLEENDLYRCVENKGDISNHKKPRECDDFSLAKSWRDQWIY